MITLRELSTEELSALLKRDHGPGAISTDNLLRLSWLVGPQPVRARLDVIEDHMERTVALVVDNDENVHTGFEVEAT